MIIKPGMLILSEAGQLLGLVCVNNDDFSTLLACDFRIKESKLTPDIHNDWIIAATFKEINT